MKWGMDGSKIGLKTVMWQLGDAPWGFKRFRSYNKLDKADEPCRAKVQQALDDWYPAEVEGSDPKSIDEIGTRAPCYLKLGELSFEAVNSRCLIIAIVFDRHSPSLEHRRSCTRSASKAAHWTEA